jgi:hypothetical protein
VEGDSVAEKFILLKTEIRSKSEAGQSHLQIVSSLNSVALCAPLASVRFFQIRTLQHGSGCLFSHDDCLNAIALKSEAKLDSVVPIHVKMKP